MIATLTGFVAWDAASDVVAQTATPASARVRATAAFQLRSLDVTGRALLPLVFRRCARFSRSSDPTFKQVGGFGVSSRARPRERRFSRHPPVGAVSGRACPTAP